jgi:ribosomal peptide maturation radical SAM protein 1
MKTILVCPPFASIARPVLGVSTLKARLSERGLSCAVAYLNLAFAEVISGWDYERIADQLPHHLLAGEWVFTECLYGSGDDPGARYLEDVLGARGGLVEEDLDLLRRARAAAPAFLERCVQEVPWGDFDVVGVSSSVAQNVATLALARRIRESHPGALIICGGANWQGEMGAELLRRFPFVDVAFSGEADESLPVVLEGLALGRAHPWKGVPGVLYRSAGRIVGEGRPASPVDLDTLPDPDHDDFFTAWEAAPAVQGLLPAITLETSRGCWWAQKAPCGFCGLDHAERPFRHKSPRRVVGELRRMAHRYRGGRLHLVDNVVAPSFLTRVLPELGAEPLSLPLFFSVRPDVSREQLRLAGAIHAHIQPGIESFSDHVLALMGKGSRSLENVRLLRWCKESGVVPHWNVIWGFPGETGEDYDAVLEMIPAITFLVPPGGQGNLSLDRYSPFHESPARHGFLDLRPLTAYSYLYPFPSASLGRLAYAFEHRCDPPSLDRGRRATLDAALTSWAQGFSGEVLAVASRKDGSFALVDDRPDAPARLIELDLLEQALYRAGDGIADRRALYAVAHGLGDSAAVDDRLDSFVGRRLMVTDGERFLSLALSRDSGW